MNIIYENNREISQSMMDIYLKYKHNRTFINNKSISIIEDYLIIKRKHFQICIFIQKSKFY